MRTQNKVFQMSVLAAFACLVSVPAFAAEPTAARSAYVAAIGDIIAKCDSKQCLKKSRSDHLRCCAQRSAAKAAYLRHHLDRLVNQMMAADVPLKTYRVERFVNARFATYLLTQR